MRFANLLFVTIVSTLLSMAPAQREGTLKWAFQTGSGVSSSPAIGMDGTVYVGSYDGNLYAITSAGKQKWAFKTRGLVGSSPAIGSDGTVYVGSMDKKLYAINPQGQQKWAFQTGGEIYSSPAIGPDGTIYVGSEDGHLYAIYSSSRGLANSPWPKFKQNNQGTGRVMQSAEVRSSGSLFISSTPLGATVLQDGKILGKSPLTLSDLAPGKYSFVLQADGYQDQTLEATVEAGKQSSSTATLARVPPQPQVVTTPVQPQTALGPKRTDVYALVLGIGSYQSERIPKLDYAASDAQQFAKALEQTANIAPENITFWPDAQATRARVEAKVEQLATNLKSTDTLIVYFSGHGAPSDKSEAMLVFWDTDPELLIQTALSLVTLKDRAKSAGRVLLILDACFSGESGSKSVTAPGAKPFGLQVKQPQGDNQFAVLASSASSESSYESSSLKGGYFTYYLLEALRGVANSPTGQITLDQAFDYVRTKVSASVRRDRNASQVPQLTGSSLSSWVFAQDSSKLAQQDQRARLQKLGDLQQSGDISDAQFDKLAEMVSTNQEHAILKAFLDGSINKQAFLNRLRAGLIPGVPSR